MQITEKIGWSDSKRVLSHRLMTGFSSLVCRLKSLANFQEFSFESIRKQLSISLLAAAFVGSNFIISNQQSNLPLSQIFLPDPSTISSIVKAVTKYTPQLPSNPNEIVNALTGQDTARAANNYVEQVAILAMAKSNPYNGYAIKYTVVAGDTWSGIAQKFNLRTSSVLAANNYDASKLKNNPWLQIGQQITIPSENIDGGPQNWVQIYNDILASSQSQTSTNSYSSQTYNSGSSYITSSGLDLTPYGGYPGGWCTAGVAKFRPDVGRNWGNAGNWYYAAASEGRAVGQTPRPGAIIVTRESGWGHVAYVQSVSGDIVNLIEMNYVAFGVFDHRSVNYHDIPTIGFIY